LKNAASGEVEQVEQVEQVEIQGKWRSRASGDPGQAVIQSKKKPALKRAFLV
tara:strand:+ start:828 stop:983 length:156 start_codon:yes stop_codon:yes gene_type:complete